MPMTSDEFVSQLDLSDMTPVQVQLILGLLERERDRLQAQHKNEMQQIEMLISEFRSEL